MNLALLAGILIGLAALAGAWRTLLARTPNRWLRIALQLIAAVLLYLVLFPPRVDESFAAGTMVLLTPGATPEKLATFTGAASVVALPGVDAPSDVERVPDLGTALRRHADTARLRVVGGGLPSRDIDAARALPIEFDASPLPKGIVELFVPASVRAGSRFEVSGRVEGGSGGRIELRDPAAAVIVQSPLGKDGTFTLSAQAKSAGTAELALHALDRDGVSIEDIALPVSVRAGADLRVLLLAGAPDADLKYLRRWAADAGVELTSRIALSDGIAMQDGSAVITPENLARTDVVITDERAWKTLDGRTKSALIDAVHAGLGLFLRITGPLPDDVAAEWRALGFDVRAADVAQAVSLQQRIGTAEPAAQLTQRPKAVDADHAAPLLRASDGSSLALWRVEGQGRIAVWWLADSYRLALGGDAGAFGTLWSEALATVARARGVASPELPAEARVDERGVICALGDSAFVERPDAKRVTLTIDADRGKNRCAAYWPAHAGWHALVADGARWPFYVRDTKEASALARAHDADATRLLAGRQATESANATRSIPAPRWPFFLAWLLAATALWWVERTRVRAVDTEDADDTNNQTNRWTAAQNLGAG
ncbi:MAG TPA: hypothetical protein VGO25_03295 [Rhodanobacteraceae bacterium]|nr:hypothetical protein [Rhodanobacteraceae bacterium]